MRVIRIKGGLGNQMFQYAYGRNLEIMGNQIVFDNSFFEGAKSDFDTARNFKLDKFNIQTKAKFGKFLTTKNLLINYLNKIKRRLGFFVDEYYQNEKYFIDIADEIKKEFTLKNDFSEKAKEYLLKIENSNSVSLHIRRGDYVTNKTANAYHGVCDLKYYYEAIKIIKEKMVNPIFFVFSDDILWAKENLKDEEFIFVSSAEIEDVEEMMLMSKCKHNIIANSSFSWWGAWLNGNAKKIVIAPKKWFNDKKAGQVDIVPNNWLRI